MRTARLLSYGGGSFLTDPPTLDRDPSHPDRDPPGHVTCACWDRDPPPPVNRITDACENITFPQNNKEMCLVLYTEMTDW